MDQNEGVTKFVVRCYRLCLGREADEDGLNAWCNALLTGRDTAKEVAHGFIFSEEYGAIDTHHSNYLELLYELLLGRKSDPEGYRSWRNQLEMEYLNCTYLMNLQIPRNFRRSVTAMV